jgi:hypothetical protein
LLRLKALPAEGGSGDTGQWIDNVIPPRQTDLEQAKFLSITMETVGFGIDRHAISRFDLWKQ